MRFLRRWAKYIILYGIIWAILCGWAYYYRVGYFPSKEAELKKLKEQFTQEVVKVNLLAIEKKRLEEEIAKLKQDRVKQEELVRTTKGMVAPGEKVIRFLEIPNTGGTDNE